MSAHSAGRLAWQSTSLALPQSVVDRAGHCRHLRGSKPPSLMCIPDTPGEKQI